MVWTVLIASGVLEASWATALGKSDGQTRLWPSVICIVVMSVGLVGLRLVN